MDLLDFTASSNVSKVGGGGGAGSGFGAMGGLGGFVSFSSSSTSLAFSAGFGSLSCSSNQLSISCVSLSSSYISAIFEALVLFEPLKDGEGRMLLIVDITDDGCCCSNKSKKLSSLLSLPSSLSSLPVFDGIGMTLAMASL